MALILSMWALLILPNWWERTQRFADGPTLSLCYVAARYGQHFNTATHAIGLDPQSTSVLLADLGGVLLTSDLEVLDLAGLTNREIAHFLRDGRRRALAAYVLDDLRPTFIHIHDDWLTVSGLDGNPRLQSGLRRHLRRPGVGATRRPRGVRQPRSRTQGAVVERPSTGAPAESRGMRGHPLRLNVTNRTR